MTHDTHKIANRAGRGPFPRLANTPDSARLLLACVLSASLTACGFADGGSSGGTASADTAATETASAGTAPTAAATDGSTAAASTGTSSTASSAASNGATAAASVSNAPDSPGVVAGTTTSTTPKGGSTSSTVNSLDTIVNDMKLVNDFVLKGYEGMNYGWYAGPGSVQMGNNPCFCNVPTWSEFYNNPAYANVTPQAMLPWVVVFQGVANTATNTAFQLRDMMFYIKSKSTGVWNVMSGPSTASGMSWGTAANPSGSAAQVNVTLADGSKAIMPPSGQLMWHGWSDAGITAINPNDIGAIFVTVQGRLVVADASKPDDRANAQYGIQVGADYYRNTTTTWGNGIAPGSGVTRTKKLTNEWQSMSYTTFNDVGSQDPGGGISEAVFRASPPPLQ